MRLNYDKLREVKEIKVRHGFAEVYVCKCFYTNILGI